MRESEFSRYLRDKLKDAGYTVDRIESHSTGVGIPDMHVVGHGDEYWLELKSMPKLKWYSPRPKGDTMTVPWRPGQRAWAVQYYAGTRGKRSLTVIRSMDAVLFLPMTSIFKENKAPVESLHDYMPFIKNDARALVFILRYETRLFDWDCTISIRSNLYNWVCNFLRMEDVDFDPDVLWGGNTDGCTNTIGYFARKQEMFETLLHSWLNGIPQEQKR